MTQKKVLIISPCYSEMAWMISAKRTAECLVKYAGYKVDVVTSNVGNFPGVEDINGVHVIRLSTKFFSDPFNYAYVPGIIGWIKKYYDKYDYIIINKYMFFTSLASFFLTSRKKFIIQTDTFPGLNWKTGITWFNLGCSIYSRTIGKMILRKAAKVVLFHTDNRYIANKLRLNHTVIHNGVDVEDYKNIEPAKDFVEYKQGNPLITWIGRLDDVKNYKLFLKVANVMHETNPKIKFAMVCGDKYSDYRRKLQEDYPFVKIEGFRKDIPNILAATDINVLTSYAEGLPNTIMEALACGVPVIATRTGGIKDLINQGREGYLFDINSMMHINIRNHIERILSSEEKRKAMSIAAKERIEKIFNLANTAKEYAKLFKEVYGE